MLCVICSTFIKTETISIHERYYDIKLSHILLDLNFKLSLQEHDQICMDCCYSVINLYNFREALSQFFYVEPKLQSICCICSKSHVKMKMKTLSNHILINGEEFKLYDTLVKLCAYDLEIDESHNICNKCCKYLQCCYQFYLLYQEKTEESINDVNQTSKLDQTKNITCGETRKSRSGLKTITTTQVYPGKQNYRCEICMKNYITRTELNVHALTHRKRFKCQYCSKSFNQRSSLKNHIRIHTGEKPFKCDYCSKSFNVKNNLIPHIRIHTGEKPFKCDYCSKSFNLKHALIYHIKIHTGEKPFKCDYCSKSFSLKHNLICHIRIHSGEKPFKCEICSKSFNQRSSLKNHVRIHTGEKPFKCDYCSKSFKVKNNLIRHIRIHTRE